MGPTSCTSAGERDYPGLAPRVSRPGYVLVAQTDHFGAALAAADLAVSRAGGTVWELAAAGTPSILVPYPHATADHQTLNARWFERGGGAIVVPDSRGEPRACPRRGAACRLEAARAHARGDAGAGSPGCGRDDRRGAGCACPLSSLSRVAVSTSSESAARGSPRTRTSRGRGGQRCAAGIFATRSSWRRSLGVEVDISEEPSPPEGWEVIVSTAHAHRSRGNTAGDVPRRARCLATGDRGVRGAWEDDDRGDDRLRAQGGGERPGVDHRRRGGPARGQRRLRRRLARCGG